MTKPLIFLSIPAALAMAIVPLAAQAPAQRVSLPAYETTAQIALLEDLSSGTTLYAKDADRRMPPASMAKMMTVQVIFDMIAKGELKESDTFTVKPETWAKWHGPAAGSTMFLSAGETVSVENLLKGIVTLSGNDACVVIAEGVAGTEQAFTERMNRTAAELGLTNSHFGTSNGWPDEGRTYVTARDLAKLAAATIEQHPQLYKKYYSLKDFTWGKTGGGADITQANRDPLLGRVAGADGLKTGHTEEAGYGFTGSAEQNGRRLVMVVAGLDSFNGRIAESVKLMDWGFKAWSARPVLKAGATIGEAQVQMGDANAVELTAARHLAATVPAGTRPALSGRIVYQGPVKAPIKAGAHVADLVVSAPGLPAQTMPLVAKTDVGEAGFFRRAWNGFVGLFA